MLLEMVAADVDGAVDVTCGWDCGPDCLPSVLLELDTATLLLLLLLLLLLVLLLPLTLPPTLPTLLALTGVGFTTMLCTQDTKIDEHPLKNGRTGERLLERTHHGNSITTGGSAHRGTLR